MFNSLRTEIKVLRNSFFRRIFLKREYEKDLISRFVHLYFDSRVDGNTFWLGVPCIKCPLDLWVYQEVIFSLMPDKIIETGTASGGSGLFLASICDHICKGQVISIDIYEYQGRPTHPRLTYLCGSSTSSDVLKEINRMVEDDDCVLVILDSDHSKEHVLKELRSYARFVNKGSYLIVEDTIINGHPVLPNFGPGPMEAVDKFLAETDVFIVDKEREKHLLTFNPRGFLLKVR